MFKPTSPVLTSTGNPGITFTPTAGLNQVVMSFLDDGSLLVIRRDDLLVLRFEFDSITITDGTDGFKYLTPTHPERALVVILVHFQPQAIAEPVSATEPTSYPVPPIAAGDTQLAFKIPANKMPMKLTIENLLDWSDFTPLLAEVALTDAQVAAQGSSRPTVQDPSNEQITNNWTYIEAPYRLLLSPDSSANWQHQQGLQANGMVNETELWHTALQTRPFAGDLRVRAIWSPDYTNAFSHTSAQSKNVYTLGPDDRNQIVHLCSNYALGSGVNSIAADQVMLTALGAWMQLRGEWPAVGQDQTQSPPPPVPVPLANYSISGWHTRATMAREHFVMLVKEGHLFPFGHRAATITITERTDGQTMYLTSKTYLVIRDRIRDLTSAGAHPSSMRQMPFQQVNLLTKSTPTLDAPAGKNPTFWPMVAGQDFLFDLAGTDIAGQTSSFQSALYFIEDSVQLNTALLATANSGMGSRLPADLRGQSVTLVPPTKVGDIDTAYPAANFSFRGIQDGNSPGFMPVIISASISVPAIHHLTNVETPIQISYTQSYLTSGIQPTAGYAKITQGAPTVKFASGDQSGGLMQPQLVLTQLAQSTGLSPADFTSAGNNAAKQIFSNFSLLGGIRLGDILPVMPPAGTTPTIKTTISADKTATTVMSWALNNSTLQSEGPFKVSSNPSTTINLNLTRVQGLQSSQSSTSIHCDLNNFTLALLGLIDVSFNSFVFDHRPGQKPNITADVKSTTFHAPLDFIQSLASIIPGNGFSNPPALDITPGGATLGYSLTLPPIAVGNFSLENVMLGSTLSIPFTGAPLVFSFYFADADHPFLLTADFVTGGGYCALELLPSGLQRLDAALEFGGNVQLDLGVASGGVTTTGGFHFGLNQSQGTTDYTVFVQASGALEVLDLIAVNTEFYVGLDYQTSQTFTGTASLSVEVSVLFFHKSVSLTMQKSYTS